MKIKVFGDEALAAVLRDLARQGPFITSNALNATAFAAQREVQNKLPQWLHLTKPQFLKQSVVVEKSTKTTPVATIGFLKRASLIELMEDGGERRPRKTALAIPVEAKRNRAGGISSANRPRELLTKKKFFSGTIDGIAGIWRHASKSLPAALMYVYKSVVSYRKKFTHFRSTVHSVAQRDLEKNFRVAMERAARTSRHR